MENNFKKDLKRAIALSVLGESILILGLLSQNHRRRSAFDRAITPTATTITREQTPTPRQ